MAIVKHGREFELGATVKKIRVEVRAGLGPCTGGLRVRLAETRHVTRHAASTLSFLLLVTSGRILLQRIKHSWFLPQARYKLCVS